jgi:hypothetical protein
MKKGINIAITILIVLVIGSIVYAVVTQEKKAGAYGEFAQCVADSGATFYGAFWCPHCIEQKRLFGDAHKTIPYVECSTADRQGQTQVCIDANVQSYPTWDFADESRETGKLPLEKIAEKTGCALPLSDENEVVNKE